MGTIAVDRVFDNIMLKLQYIFVTTTALILSLNTVSISDANASIISSKQKSSSLLSGKRERLSIKEYQLAQGKTTKPKSDTSDDEMLDALQKRQDKIEQNLGKLKKLTGTDSVTQEREEVPMSDDEMIDALNQRQQKIQELKKLKELKQGSENPSSIPQSSGKSSLMAFKMLAIGLPVSVLVFLIATPFTKGLFGVWKSNYQEKYGKPKVPEGSINLHSRSFQEITLIGNKAEKINNDKFGNEEFLLLLRIKINMSKESSGYKGLGNCVDLLQAGIIAQKSFLRLEQTELRYRSRKQQEFYQYVADNLEDDLDREEFAKKIKKKQAEILPLITTEEGRGAIDTYTKEINVLSKYKLGLKLLALFKQYELKDFSILKNVSDVVETLAGKDLLDSSDLVSPVLEHYESFEKLSPILGLSKAESTPQAYAKILQVIGLTNRHGKAYLEFGQLVELLKKWEQPYKAIAIVRKEYTEDKYSLPAEFKEDIPGFKVYQRYAEYLPDL